MYQREYHRSGGRGQARPPATVPARGANPVLALQRVLGNRDTARLLARKGGSSHGTFEHSVQIGKLGPIEVKESNVDAWTGKGADADDLTMTTVKGKHSDELKRLADAKTRLDSIAVQSITGQNSWVIVTFKNARIRGYELDASGDTEHWKAVGFDDVDIERTSIGMPRP